MQGSQLLSEGLSLMGLGMGFVFIFLAVLVATMTLMSRIIGRFFPPPPAVSTAVSGKATTAPSPQQDEALMAVISAAIHQHRQRHRR